MEPNDSSGSAKMSLDNILERIGMSPDKFHKDFKTHEANAKWFEENTAEIRKKYGGQLVIVADETIYPISITTNYESNLADLSKQGVNVDAALKIVVPREGEIPPIRFGPLYFKN